MTHETVARTLAMMNFYPCHRGGGCEGAQLTATIGGRSAEVIITVDLTLPMSDDEFVEVGGNLLDEDGGIIAPGPYVECVRAEPDTLRAEVISVLADLFPDASKDDLARLLQRDEPLPADYNEVQWRMGSPYFVSHQADPLAVRGESVHALAHAMMGTRPDLAEASLDEWVADHTEKLTAAERKAATAIVELFEERGQ